MAFVSHPNAIALSKPPELAAPPVVIPAERRSRKPGSSSDIATAALDPGYLAALDSGMTKPGVRQGGQ